MRTRHFPLRPVAAAGAAALAVTLAACSGQAASDHANIAVSPRSALADQAISIKVTGLAGGQKVTVSAKADSGDSITWEADASFTADANGTVDLAAQAPGSGSYKARDPMGLIWSMLPQDGAPPTGNFVAAPPQDKGGYPVRLTVSSGGKTIGSTTITRNWTVPGEKATVLTLAKDKVSGTLFTPPADTPRHPGVLIFGGAEGGNDQGPAAALLAAHGYPALSLDYFNPADEAGQVPGLPDQLDEIPLEYFAAAGRILAKQPSADPAHILPLGYSRGSEAAQLLADHFPSLFHGAIVYSPSSDANASATDSERAGWTIGGKEVPLGPIALDHVSGPVLAIAGGDDRQWDSVSSANTIVHTLTLDGDRYPHQSLVYPDAGHWVGTQPYEPAAASAYTTLGGSAAADVAAQRKGWPAVLSLLASLT